MAALPPVAPAAAAEPRWLIEGLVDTALADGSADATLTGRNDGNPAGDGTLRLWAVAEPHPRLQAVLLGAVEAASDADGGEAELEQALLRVALRRDRRLQLEAGRLGPLLGNFSRRFLPNVNPLIGQPISYSTAYPVGVQLIGVVSRLDFRLGWVDEPLTNERFLPEPDSAYRPAVAVGVTPFTGLRIGGYHTAGPYLSERLADRLDPGTGWKSLDQRVSGVEVQFAHRHVEMHADWSDVAYDAPPAGERHRGEVWFVEARATWSPRLFSAVRWEHSRYVGLAWRNGEWAVRKPTVEMIEAGAGYRLDRNTTVKGSLTVERWSVSPQARPYYPDGESVGLQVVRRFDVLGWFERAR